MYWEERLVKTQNAITNKTIVESKNQLYRYYKKSAEKVIESFEGTYKQLLEKAVSGEEISVSNLYQLDKYWKMEQTLKQEMRKLGKNTISLLLEKFEKQYESIYNSITFVGDKAFTTLSKQSAIASINNIWCADGKNWSDRVWGNTQYLSKTLNEELVQNVILGKERKQLRDELIKRFNVSFSQANTLIRTETAHIQTQAAIDRYKSAGITSYKFYADTDEKSCDKCAELDGKIFLFSEGIVGVNMPPMHPNDRCCIVPISNF